MNLWIAMTIRILVQRGALNGDDAHLDASDKRGGHGALI
jgi:hypothetical protein